MKAPTICTTDTATNQLLGARLGICNLQVLSSTVLEMFRQTDMLQQDPLASIIENQDTGATRGF
jgi:hypothetical protein